jgi:uncharacterized membrane protein
MVDATTNPVRQLSILEPRGVGVLSPFRWLRLGWQDFVHSLRASLAHGLLITAMGWVVLMFTSGDLYLFTAAISGFLLISPLMATGLYELSRRRELGQPVTFDASLGGLKNNGSRLIQLATILVLCIFAWFGLSHLIFREFFGGSMPVLAGAIYQTSWRSGGPGFLLVYGAVGGGIALLVFVLSVISVPMMMDRGTALATAMSTSVRTVWRNVPAMLLWGLLLTALTLVGFATQLWAMIVIIPWLGHATWHAYRDTVG